mmetsp:Transcript_19239/g.50499  ORF Transcript_19239/g.50499 Transcript_19239/m.50499 type:complete len:236 (-) Transcript_19239:119-826(-)
MLFFFFSPSMAASSMERLNRTNFSSSSPSSLMEASFPALPSAWSKSGFKVLPSCVARVLSLRAASIALPAGVSAASACRLASASNLSMAPLISRDCRLSTSFSEAFNLCINSATWVFNEAINASLSPSLSPSAAAITIGRPTDSPSAAAIVKAREAQNWKASMHALARPRASHRDWPGRHYKLGPVRAEWSRRERCRTGRPAGRSQRSAPATSFVPPRTQPLSTKSCRVVQCAPR